MRRTLWDPSLPTVQRLRASLSLAAPLVLAGCLFTAEDTTVVVDGLVYDETLGRPAEGLSVVMVQDVAGWFIDPHEVVAQAETDADGRYHLAYDPGQDNVNVEVYVNLLPMDAALLSPWYGLRSGDRVSRVTPVYRFATLVVRAETNGTPPDGTETYIEAPGRGGRNGPVTTESARANAFNRVRLVVDRESTRTERVDSVYCPLGVVTEYVFRY